VYFNNVFFSQIFCTAAVEEPTTKMSKKEMKKLKKKVKSCILVDTVYGTFYMTYFTWKNHF